MVLLMNVGCIELENKAMKEIDSEQQPQEEQQERRQQEQQEQEQEQQEQQSQQSIGDDLQDSSRTSTTSTPMSSFMAPNTDGKQELYRSPDSKIPDGFKHNDETATAGDTDQADEASDGVSKVYRPLSPNDDDNSNGSNENNNEIKMVREDHPDLSVSNNTVGASHEIISRRKNEAGDSSQTAAGLLAIPQSSVVAKKRKQTKYKKAPQAPRRFKSAYMFFSTDKHRAIRAELTSQGKAEKVRVNTRARVCMCRCGCAARETIDTAASRLVPDSY